MALTSLTQTAEVPPSFGFASWNFAYKYICLNGSTYPSHFIRDWVPYWHYLPSYSEFLKVLYSSTLFIIILLAFTIHLRSLASSVLRFRDHTQGNTTVGMTPLDEWSVRCRDLTNTQHSQQTNIHAPCGIRTRNPSRWEVSSKLQTLYQRNSEIFHLKSKLPTNLQSIIHYVSFYASSLPTQICMLYIYITFLGKQLKLHKNSKHYSQENSGYKNREWRISRHPTDVTPPLSAVARNHRLLNGDCGNDAHIAFRTANWGEGGGVGGGVQSAVVRVQVIII
jgi:hypothetical protein